MEDSEKWISPKVIADTMDVSVDTVLAMARRGELAGVRFGGQIRISQQSFVDYLEQHRVSAEKKGERVER